MNIDRFRRELAVCGRVDSFDSLPRELRLAAEGSRELGELVEERIAVDLLLDQVEEIEPAAGSAAKTAEAAFRDQPEALPASRDPVLHILRSPIQLIAALLMIGLSLGLLRLGEPPTEVDDVDPGMLAQLELLMDWETLEEHGDDLDLLACNELATLLEDLADEAEQPR